MWGPFALALMVTVPVPSATEPESAQAPLEAEAAPLRLVWEAGLHPVAPEDYLLALRARLPPGRFEEAPAAADPRTWVVTVEQPNPGVYRLVIAPPDRQAVARRIDLPDPSAARRTLALLTVFALEHGAFPPLSAGVSEDVAPRPEPGHGQKPQPLRPARPLGTAAPPRDIRWRLVGHVLGGPWLAAPTAGESNAVALAATGAFDIGLTYRRWLWAGFEGRYAGYPSPSVDVHRVGAGGFVGVHPRLRRDGTLQPGVKLGAGGGILHGRGEGQDASRPFFSGSLATGLDWEVTHGLLLSLWLAVAVASRASTFATPDDTVGIGHVRGGALLGLGWTFPLGP